jgi:hypothetical protein
MKNELIKSILDSSKKSFEKKLLLYELMSEKSNLKRNESVFRRERLKGLELDYN